MKTLLAMIILMASTGVVLAQTTCQQVGQYRYCNGPNGSQSTTQQLGNYTYQNGTVRDGNGGSYQYQRTCQQIGQYTYCN
jgi:hypothetical protein